MSKTFEEQLNESVFLVEASSFEQYCLWSQHAPESDNRIHDLPTKYVTSWESENPGTALKIGELAGMPITISFNHARINGQLVTFYDVCSQVVDHRQVNQWIKDHFNKTWDNGTRRAVTDASNFHHCIHTIDDINKEEKKRLRDINLSLQAIPTYALENIQFLTTDEKFKKEIKKELDRRGER